MWTERFEEIGKLDYHQFRTRLDQVMGRVAERGVCVTVADDELDKPMAIILNFEDFLELIDDLEAISAMVGTMDLADGGVSLDEVLEELAKDEE
ncbi:MAG: hypothetical protein PHV61_04440 [Limnochordia bacterium]|nr:hypothetical protein [Limnochordia bacterium]MDD2629400.1 hypothetical protein [Limnochordia bacterium]MDD4516973.1 hypothetical protein [Limnochordia bacterium]